MRYADFVQLWDLLDIVQAAAAEQARRHLRAAPPSAVEGALDALPAHARPAAQVNSLLAAGHHLLRLQGVQVRRVAQRAVQDHGRAGRRLRPVPVDRAHQDTRAPRHRQGKWLQLR